MSIAYKGKTVAALAKLKFLVSMDPIETDTVRFWENHGEFNDVDTASDPDRGVHAAGDLLRRGGGHAHQLQPLHPVEVEGGRSPSPSRAPTSRSWPISSCASASSTRRRAAPGVEPLMAIDWSYADPLEPTADELLRELNGKALADLRRRRRQGHPQGRRAARQLRRDAGRRLDRRLHVDLHRRLRAERQPLPAAGQQRSVAVSASTATGASPGRPTAASSTTAPRPIPQGKPWSEAKKYIVLGRRALDRAGRAGLRRRPIPPDRATGPFIMNPEGVSRLWVRGHDGGRPVPGPLRAVRVAGRQPAVPEGQGQPGGAGVQQRHGDLRRRRRVPDRRDHLPADRALPLLDQERAHRTRCCSPRPSWSCRSSSPRRRGSRHGQLVRIWSQPRRGEGQGGGHQAAEAAADRRQDRAHRRAAAALRLHRPDQEGVADQLADAAGGGRQRADAGVQGVPGRYRAHRRSRWHREGATCFHRSRTPPPNPSRRSSARRT